MCSCQVVWHAPSSNEGNGGNGDNGDKIHGIGMKLDRFRCQPLHKISRNPDEIEFTVASMLAAVLEPTIISIRIRNVFKKLH